MATKKRHLADGDYVLTDGRAWLEIKSISVRVHETDEGVVVDIYANGKEDHSPLASAYAFFAEAEDDTTEDEQPAPRPAPAN